MCFSSPQRIKSCSNLNNLMTTLDEDRVMQRNSAPRTTLQLKSSRSANDVVHPQKQSQSGMNPRSYQKICLGKQNYPACLVLRTYIPSRFSKDRSDTENPFKLSLEYYLNQPLSFWPLAELREPCPGGYTRLYWDCIG